MEDSEECAVIFQADVWLEAHQEEELFEMASLNDEDKVIAALWSRWMMSNRCSPCTKTTEPTATNFTVRQAFLGNRFEGTLHFIRSSYKLIHRAAGRAALFAFLLVPSISFSRKNACLDHLQVLISQRCLGGKEVADILKTYDDLAAFEKKNIS